MSNASTEEEANLLHKVKNFYSKASSKSSPQEPNESSPKNPEKKSNEGNTPTRSKRRRIECKRYSGFVIEPLKRNELSRASTGIQGLFNAADTKVSCPRSRKKSKSASLELAEPKVVTARQKRTLDVPLHHSVEYQDLFEPSNETKGLNASAISNKSEKLSRQSQGTEEVMKEDTAPQPSSQTDDKQIPSNPSKLKRKHALCAIFEDIWNPKKPVAVEKQPQINGFKQMFHDVFSKVPQVCEKRIETPALAIPSPAPPCSESILLSETTDNESNSEIKKSSDSTNYLNSDVVNFDLLLSHEEEIKTAQSGDELSTSNWLQSVQSTCNARSKLISLQLIIRKCVPPPTLKNEHRKKRKRRCRKRKTRPHLTDADDEHSDSQLSRPRPCSPLTGPLKLITLEDLWVQKEFYLRYLCNYYHISSEGCKGWLISRLHQFILQSAGSSTFTRHRTFKLFPTPRRRSNQAVSWVKLTVERKTKLLDE